MTNFWLNLPADLASLIVADLLHSPVKPTTASSPLAADSPPAVSRPPTPDIQDSDYMLYGEACYAPCDI